MYDRRSHQIEQRQNKKGVSVFLDNCTDLVPMDSSTFQNEILKLYTVSFENN